MTKDTLQEPRTKSLADEAWSNLGIHNLTQIALNLSNSAVAIDKNPKPLVEYYLHGVHAKAFINRVPNQQYQYSWRARQEDIKEITDKCAKRIDDYIHDQYDKGFLPIDPEAIVKIALQAKKVAGIIAGVFGINPNPTPLELRLQLGFEVGQLNEIAGQVFKNPAQPVPAQTA